MASIGLAVPPSAAEPPAIDEVVERILALEDELRRLLANLPPEKREAVEALLARRRELEAERTAADAQHRPAVSPQASSPVAPRAEASPGPRSQLGCDLLAAFDSDGDGRVDATDRHWRHLYLWVDRDGDRQLEARELRSVYDAGVREIEVDLSRFIAKGDRSGEIRAAGHLVLDLRGDGIVASGGASQDDAVLVVDASELRRAGAPISSADGEPLEGLQALVGGMSIVRGNGETVTWRCP